MGRLTTHVLDTTRGRPAGGLSLRLYRVEGETRTCLTEARTNADGRCDAPLLEGAALTVGRYVIEFEAGEYLRAAGLASSEPLFLDVVPIAFGVADAAGHYHVPLLLSPFAYSTYRGS
jgi:5-hydroxyisourate hydrolase